MCFFCWPFGRIYDPSKFDLPFHQEFPTIAKPMPCHESRWIDSLFCAQTMIGNGWNNQNFLTLKNWVPDNGQWNLWKALEFDRVLCAQVWASELWACIRSQLNWPLKCQQATLITWGIGPNSASVGKNVGIQFQPFLSAHRLQKSLALLRLLKGNGATRSCAAWSLAGWKAPGTTSWTIKIP